MPHGREGRSRSRALAEHTASVPSTSAASVPSTSKEVEWPSAKDILASCRAASSSRLPSTWQEKRRRENAGIRCHSHPVARAVPLGPARLAGRVGRFLFILSAGLLGCTLSWSWAHDSYMASIVTDRLLTSDRVGPAQPAPRLGPTAREGLDDLDLRGTWRPGRFSSVDPRETTTNHPQRRLALLERALAASPINAQARLALAQLEPADSDEISFGYAASASVAMQSAWHGVPAACSAAGKKEDALKLYGRAISVAVPDSSSRSPVPRFSEDPGVPPLLAARRRASARNRPRPGLPECLDV